jgi:large subunit ribosomal protein L5|tara:strand:+ start:751 stop:1326 length:576 start_codon:yes stop_codon:yes gene_type:complete
MKEAVKNNMPGMKSVYLNEVKNKLTEEFGYKNQMEIPKMQKIAVNVGMGESLTNKNAIESMLGDLTLITGQKPVVTKAKISIANFNLREGMRVGIKVTLRSKRMWDFWDRLVNLSLPRIRDFRGISANSFDGNGNYNLGIREHIIFPEIDYGKVDKIRSFQITIATSAKTDQEGYKLLQLLGMPFMEVKNG